MNNIDAIIKKISRVESLYLIELEFHNSIIFVITLELVELNETIEENSTVTLSINPNAILISKDFNSNISISNRLKATVSSYEIGKIFVKVWLKLEDSTIIESLISKISFDNLSLNINDKVDIFIKETDINI